MKNRSKLLIACVLAFALCIGMTITGCSRNSQSGYSNGIPESKRVVEVQSFDFDSIEITGTLDLDLVGRDYFKYVLDDYEYLGDVADAGKVVIISQEGNEAPTATVKGGKLIIDAPRQYKIKNYCPAVIVFCGDKTLKLLKVESDACDLDVSGVSFESAELDISAGDIDLDDVTSVGVKMKVAAGDIDISGTLKGITEITMDAGEVEVETSDDLSIYTMDLSVQAGEISVGGKDKGNKYSQEGGKDTINVKVDAGEIEIEKR